MSDHWGVNVPHLTEDEASQLVTYGLDALGLKFAYTFDQREWLSWGLDHEGVRTLVAALKLSGLGDRCATGLLEILEEWLSNHDELDAAGEFD